MRFNVPNLLKERTIAGVNHRINQVIGLVLAAALAVGCGGDGERGGNSGILSDLSGIMSGSEARGQASSTLIESGVVFFGAAAGDEPNAVIAAEDILKFGGSAADAAVALALTMTVTMPSSISLGGGGVCIVHDPGAKKTEVMDFIAPPGALNAQADRPSAIPTLLRGLAALQVRYGQLELRQILAKTEKKARFGHIVSRATARELALAARPLFLDPNARKIFSRPDGKPHEEGDRLIQQDLADTYAALRTGGITSFYEGPLAEKIVKAVQDAGGTLSVEDLRNFVPRWRKPVGIPFDDVIINFIPSPTGAGVGGGLMWNMLAVEGRFEGTEGAARMHLLLETAKRAYAARPSWLKSDGTFKAEQAFADPGNVESLMANFNRNVATPISNLHPVPVPVLENPAGTGFVIVDLVGLAVACNLTNYNLFGTGRVAPGTGIVLAAAPGQADRNALSLGPVLTFDAEFQSFRSAIAGSGGAAAMTATTSVLAISVQQGATLKKAIEAPRGHHGGAPNIAVLEASVPENVKRELELRGHKTAVVPTLGKINAVECPLGLDARSENIACFVHADPRGAGLATEAER